MAKRRKATSTIYESFSDLALMTLGLIIFLFVIITITTQIAEKNELPKLRKQIARLEQQLKLSEADKERLKKNIEKLIVTDPENEASTNNTTTKNNHKKNDLFI